jgi:hypothetical protein
MTPYEMYMKSLSAPAGPMGQTGEVYGQRDAVMRKGMRSPAAMGSGMPFGLAPTPGVIGDGIPKTAPGTAGPVARLDGSAMDSLWSNGGNSDADIMARRSRPPMEERVQQMVDNGGFQGGQSRDAIMGRPGGMGAPAGMPAAGGQQPKRGLLTGDDPMMKLGGIAGLLQGFARAPGAANMAAPVNGGHFAGTGAGGLFNKGGMKFFG